ncbi:MAG: hypothetical protein WA913_14745 [Pricia sp.]
MTCELQDIADIISTHLENGSWHKTGQVDLKTPLLNEDGATAIAPGKDLLL